MSTMFMAKFVIEKQSDQSILSIGTSLGLENANFADPKEQIFHIREVLANNPEVLAQYLTFNLEAMKLGHILRPIVQTTEFFIGADVTDAFQNNMGEDAVKVVISVFANTLFFDVYDFGMAEV